MRHQMYTVNAYDLTILLSNATYDDYAALFREINGDSYDRIPTFEEYATKCRLRHHFQSLSDDALRDSYEFIAAKFTYDEIQHKVADDYEADIELHIAMANQGKLRAIKYKD